MKAKRDFQVLRVIPVLIAVCVCVLPAQAKYSGGTGEPNDPYQIATAADLMLLGDSPSDYGKYFILTADIDLDPNLPGRRVFGKAVIAPASPTVPYPYAQGTPFTGVFDGNGHTISHLTIKGGSDVGLFGRVGPGAEVRDMAVVDVNVTGSSELVSGLVGYNQGRVARCYSTGVVNGSFCVGGLVGLNEGAVTQCYSTGVVSGDSSVGGLVGEVIEPWPGYYGTVTQCYSTGAVNGNFNVGGLVGTGGSRVTHSIWDVETAGLVRSPGGVGLTTAEMMDPYILGLNGFGGDPNWVLDAGLDYPRLAWQGAPGGIVPPPELGWLDGQGTADAPYQLCTADQLILLGKAGILWDQHLVLCADIDLGARPIFAQAVVSVFTGVFDGNGHTISHLTIKGQHYLGLFGLVGPGAEVRDMGVVDVNVTGSGEYVGGLVGENLGTLTLCYSTGVVSGEARVGGLVGHNNYNGKGKGGKVTQCYSTGTVSGTRYGVGGLVGDNSEGSVTQCYSTGRVSGRDYVGGLVGENYGQVSSSYSTGSVGGNSSVGGLVGSNYMAGVHRCYSTGTVSGNSDVGGLVGVNGDWGTVTQGHSTGSVTGGSDVGGLVGLNAGGVTQCYSSGAVTGGYNVGGLVGWSNGTVADCYSTGEVSGERTVGGLVGRNAVNWRADLGIVSHSFWDTGTSDQIWSDGGTGLTTAEMQTARTFLDAGWDFESETANGTEEVWWILEGKGYPRLAWEHWGLAFSPHPADGAYDVTQSPILSWFAAWQRPIWHDVYFGTDKDAVANAIHESQGVYRGRQMAEVTRYDPGMLECSRTYYWRIDEVNEADPNSPRKGEVWSFTTADFIVAVVDDFESYTDDRVGWIGKTWISGSDNGTGSWVGNFDAPFAEQVIVHSGKQSMPMEYCNDAEPWFYDDDPWYSEAQRTWETPQDWTVNGVEALTLYFRGQVGNGLDPLYVRVEDSVGHSVMVPHPDPNAMLATQWQKWHIFLADLRVGGVDLAAVKKLAIGVGDRSNPKPGGTGKIYIDDIRLTKRMP